jgi:transcription initiation factor TFIID TATA-box-binding protein
MVHITNTLCSSNLGCTFDLSDLCGKISNGIYNPKKFPALIWHHRNIKAKCLLFRTGYISLNGAKTMEEARKCIRQYARLLQKMGYQVKLTKIKLNTMSAVHQLSGPVNYIDIVNALQATYEPEIFTAAMLKREGVHFTIFRTGKILITGLKSMSMLDEIVYPTLLELELCVNS